MYRSNKYMGYTPLSNFSSRRTYDSGRSEAGSVIEHQSKQHIDRYCLIWFDAQISFQRNGPMQESLRSMIDDLYVLRDLASVERKVQQLRIRKIFLVIHGSVEKNLLSRLQRRTQVAAIYIYCKKPQVVENLLTTYPKLKCITNEFGYLWNCLKKDVYMYEKVDASRIITNESAVFQRSLEYQRFIRQRWPNFYYTEPSSGTKELMLRTLQDYYNNNNEIMNKALNDFKQTIGPNTAINWYSSNTLIYRLVNNALQRCDWDLIDKFQYFIDCLHMELRREHSLFIKKCQKNPIITLYRGQLMTKVNFDCILTRSSKYLLATCFTTASFQEEVAMNFIHASEPSSDEMRVLLKIIIDTSLKNMQPFADITHLSAHPDEEEVLIMFGAIFHVKQVFVKSHKNIPVIILELCPNQQEDRIDPTYIYDIEATDSLENILDTM